MSKSKKVLYTILIVIVVSILSVFGYNKLLDSKAQKVVNTLASAASVEKIFNEDALRATAEKLSEAKGLKYMGLNISDDYLILSYRDLFNNTPKVKARIDR